MFFLGFSSVFPSFSQLFPRSANLDSDAPAWLAIKPGRLTLFDAPGTEPTIAHEKQSPECRCNGAHYENEQPGEIGIFWASVYVIFRRKPLEAVLKKKNACSAISL